METESRSFDLLLTFTQTLANVKRDLKVVKLSIAKEIPTRLATLDILVSFQQQRRKLGSFIHNEISEKFALVGRKSISISNREKVCH